MNVCSVFSQGVLSQIQQDKYICYVSAEKQKAFRTWLEEFKAQEKALEATRVLKSEIGAKLPAVPSFPQSYNPRLPSDVNIPDNACQQHAAPRGRTERGPRYRTSFDPVTELPLLKSWFKSNSSPDSSSILQYTNILNSREGRGNKRPLDEYSIKIWFKNARAKHARESTKPQHESIQTCSADAPSDKVSVQNCINTKVQVSN